MCIQMPHQDGSSKEAVGVGFLSVLWKQVPFCSASLANTLGVPHPSEALFLLLEGVDSARTHPSLPALPAEHPRLSLFLQRCSQRTGSASDPTRERPVRKP